MSLKRSTTSSGTAPFVRLGMVICEKPLLELGLSVLMGTKKGIEPVVKRLNSLPHLLS